MIEIRTFGRTSVSVDGAELTGEAAWPRSLALLVYLAREPGPDRRDDVLGVLWPDRDEKRARHALNQLLYTLRKTHPQLDLESIKDKIDFATKVWLDIDEFDRRLEENDLEGAVELYQGPFLTDLVVGTPAFDHWADRQRAEAQRKFRKAAIQLAERAKERGDHDRAIEFARRIVRIDPLVDEAQHVLIESLHLSGDRVGALRQYESYKETLARELDVEPLDHTVDLVSRIRAEPVSSRGSGSAGVEAEGAAADVAEDGSGVAAGAASHEAPVEPARTTGTAAAGRAATRPGVEGGRERRSLALAVLTAAAVVIVVAAVVWVGPWREGPQPAAVLAAGDVIPEATRIAVLPFETHGLAGAADDMAIGIAQLMARNLSEADAVEAIDHRTVISRWTASGMARERAPAPEDMRSLATELGATSVLFGAVHRSGEEIRLMADLVNASSGDVLARADVRGPGDELFDLTDRLTAQLLQRVAIGAD